MKNHLTGIAQVKDQGYLDETASTWLGGLLADFFVPRCYQPPAPDHHEPEENWR